MSKQNRISSIKILQSSKDYELIDSGNGEKLERFGEFILARPDPQALWSKKLDGKEWKKAHAHFERRGENSEWKVSKDVPSRWSMELSGLKFWIRPTSFKHTGLFPEQALNWDWMSAIQGKSAKKDEYEVLNLFGYTGGATLACSRAGAKVVHVDGSKVAITWARENAELSELGKRPIRWILDDARAFVKREIKRGRKYKGIVMDPPAFGHGPKKELWKIEEHLPELIKDCFAILDDSPLFFVLNGYSAGYSAIAYSNMLSVLADKFGGTLEMGELAIEENSQEIPTVENRLLPCGIFARWSKE